MVKFRKNIALFYGINAAIIADYLWEQLRNGPDDGKMSIQYDRVWVRCSQIMMTGEFPFMSKHMVKDAVDLLIEKSILIKDHFNDSRFDRTNWYAFTNYGAKLMKEGEAT